MRTNFFRYPFLQEKHWNIELQKEENPKQFPDGL